MWFGTAENFTATCTPGVVRVYGEQDATVIWEYSRQLGVQDVVHFYYEGYGSGAGGDFILYKFGNNPAIPADEYSDRITYIGSGQRTGFILQDIVEGDVTEGRYSIWIISIADPRPPDVPFYSDDAVISIYRK